MYRELKKFKLICDVCRKIEIVESEFYTHDGRAKLDDGHLRQLGWIQQQTFKKTVEYDYIEVLEICKDCLKEMVNENAK